MAPVAAHIWPPQRRGARAPCTAQLSALRRRHVASREGRWFGRRAAARVLKLAVGDVVVYGAHGAGSVSARETRKLEGGTHTVVVLALPGGLWIELPLDRANEQLRPLADAAEVARVQGVLGSDGIVSGETWLTRRRHARRNSTRPSVWRKSSATGTLVSNGGRGSERSSPRASATSCVRHAGSWHASSPCHAGSRTTRRANGSTSNSCRRTRGGDHERSHREDPRFVRQEVTAVHALRSITMTRSG